MKFDLINTLTIVTEDAPLEKGIQVTIPWFQEDLSKCLYYAFSYFNPQFAWDMCMQICVLKREHRALTVIMKDDEHIRQDINSKEVVMPKNRETISLCVGTIITDFLQSGVLKLTDHNTSFQVGVINLLSECMESYKSLPDWEIKRQEIEKYCEQIRVKVIPKAPLHIPRVEPELYPMFHCFKDEQVLEYLKTKLDKSARFSFNHEVDMDVFEKDLCKLSNDLGYGMPKINTTIYGKVSVVLMEMENGRSFMLNFGV